MQIIIPMSGFGERFRRVGYEVPKPLIEIKGKPIIAHIIDLFSGESNFAFTQDLDDTKNTLINFGWTEELTYINKYGLPVYLLKRNTEHD